MISIMKQNFGEEAETSIPEKIKAVISYLKLEDKGINLLFTLGLNDLDCLTAFLSFELNRVEVWSQVL